VKQKLITFVTVGSMSAAVLLAAVGVGCAKINVSAPGGGGRGGGLLSTAKGVGSGLEKIAESGRDITPEEEYNYGRAICATTFGRSDSPLLEDEALTAYVSQVGGVLAAVSDRPDLYRGYVFGVINSDQVNAFAAPGGFILITKGTLAQCRNEDELAAVLAHEIAHIELGHPSNALKEAKKTAGLAAVAKAGAEATGAASRVPGGANLNKVIDGLGDLYTKGYDRGLEDEADGRAVTLLVRAGYDPNAMTAMLDRMSASSKPELFSSHYKPEKRAETVRAAIAKVGSTPPLDPAREARFKAAVRPGG
jgi:predicted Zn-dependent protease